MSLVWIKGKLHKNNGYMIMYESFWSTKNSVNNIFGFDAVFYFSAMSLVWIEGELNKNNGYTIHLNFICLAKSRLLKKSKGSSLSKGTLPCRVKKLEFGQRWRSALTQQFRGFWNVLTDSQKKSFI